MSCCSSFKRIASPLSCEDRLLAELQDLRWFIDERQQPGISLDLMNKIKRIIASLPVGSFLILNTHFPHLFTVHTIKEIQPKEYLYAEDGKCSAKDLGEKKKVQGFETVQISPRGLFLLLPRTGPFRSFADLRIFLGLKISLKEMQDII